MITAIDEMLLRLKNVAIALSLYLYCFVGQTVEVSRKQRHMLDTVISMIYHWL